MVRQDLTVLEDVVHKTLVFILKEDSAKGEDLFFYKAI